MGDEYDDDDDDDDGDERNKPIIYLFTFQALRTPSNTVFALRNSSLTYVPPRSPNLRRRGGAVV